MQKVSLIDYPGKISAVIFLYGCNFRCGFCHNPELVVEKPLDFFYSKDEVISFLKKRIGKLDGVVISGGEPLLTDSIFDLINWIKKLNYSIKLDTNGSFPEKLQELISQKQIDYIAMDIKGPLNDYSVITGVHVDTNKIKKSIDLVMKSGIDYEFRTTLIRKFHNIDKVNDMGQLINGAKLYYLQNFRSGNIIDNKLNGEKPFTSEEIDTFSQELKKYVKKVQIR